MNNVQQQFADEWKKVSAVVESEARRQLLTFGYLDYSMLNDVLRDERETWFKSHSVRNQWLEGLGESREKVATRLRQVHLQDVYHVGNKRVSTSLLKALSLLLSFLAGFAVWLGIDQSISPSAENYLSTPLKWIAFPLLTTVLVYTLCLPRMAQAKEKKVLALIDAVTEEMMLIGQEIAERAIKSSNLE